MINFSQFSPTLRRFITSCCLYQNDFTFEDNYYTKVNMRCAIVLASYDAIVDKRGALIRT